MTNPHHPVSYPIDAHPVRPGTSAALTARTIDATVHPPLVRAQETAATIVPRMAQATAPLREPLVLAAIAAALTFVLIARRMRYQPSAILVAALLIMSLSSFHPMEPQLLAGPKIKTPTPRTLSREVSAQIGRRVYGQYGEEPVQVIAEAPPPAREPEAPAYSDYPASPTYDGIPIDPRQWVPPDLIERMPELSDDLMRGVERAMRENEQMRQLMARVRYQVREEARRQRWRRTTMRRHVRPQELESIGMVITPY